MIFHADFADKNEHMNISIKQILHKTKANNLRKSA